MAKIYYFGRKSDNVKEGGIARDNALYEYLKKYDLKYVGIKDNSKLHNKLLNLINIVFIFLKKNKKVFILYPNLGAPLQGSSLLRKIYLIFLKIGAKRNKVFVDISDLPIERAENFKTEIPYFYKEVESVLFSLNAIYLFSSYHMRDYICEKYKISIEKTEICLNGSNKIDEDIEIKKEIKDFFSINKVNFAYAGTLSQGRRIENMLDIFIKNSEKSLILMGINGEWIREYTNAENIKYLGALPEKEAHKVTSFADVGLLPYDDESVNNNIILPIKMPFYLTGGISFISTMMNEVILLTNKYDVGKNSKISNWENIVENIDEPWIEEEKKKIDEMKKEFYWENIFKVLDIYL